MNFLKIIKQIFLLLLTILLGAQAIYAKTEFVLPQIQVVSSIEKYESFKSLEKVIQPNIGFLKEKSKFVESEGVYAQNQHEFSEYFVCNLVNTGGDFVEGIVNGVRRYNVAGEIAPASTSVTLVPATLRNKKIKQNK